MTSCHFNIIHYGVCRSQHHSSNRCKVISRHSSQRLWGTSLSAEPVQFKRAANAPHASQNDIVQNIALVCVGPSLACAQLMTVRGLVFMLLLKILRPLIATQLSMATLHGTRSCPSPRVTEEHAVVLVRVGIPRTLPRCTRMLLLNEKNVR